MSAPPLLAGTMDRRRDLHPSECPYRAPLSARGDDAFCCQLVQSVTAPASANDCVVSVEVCRACCRGGPASLERPNPAVASLVCTVTSHLMDRDHLTADQTARLLEARQFAVAFLEVAAVRPTPRAAALNQDERRTVVPNGPPDERGRTRNGDRPRVIGRVGAAIHAAVRARWTNIRGAQPKIGLLGVDNQRGLGCQNRHIAQELGVDRWLVPADSGRSPPSRASFAGVASACRIDVCSIDIDKSRLEKWLEGLNHIVFVERPYFDGLTTLAHERGVSVSCVANWEWLHPGLDWVGEVDQMIAPTRFTAELLERWKRQFGYTWEVRHLPWPIESAAFPFRPRRFCKTFLFVNGAGGVRPTRRDGTPADYCRKGFDVVCRAARMVPEIPIIAYSQVDDLPPLPPNVELRSPPERNIDLYRDGDVCLQPSHWEGLGLPLLECQASGLPLVTTDAPPMNEHNPLVAIAADAFEAVSLPGQFSIVARTIQPEDLAGVMSSLFRRDIRLDSLRARRFVEREHDWRSGWRQFRRWLRQRTARRAALAEALRP